MSKKFKQVSTGLTLVCSREDVTAQYEKYPDLYIPLNDKPEKKSAKAEAEKAKSDSAKTADEAESATKADTAKTPEKK